MALQVLRTKFGRWLSSQNGQAGLDVEERIEDSEGGETQLLRRQGDGPSLVDAGVPLQRKNQTEVFEQAVNRMVEKLDRINENLHRQNEQNGDLFRRVDRLPELLETLPSMVAGQKEVVEALLVELKSRANRDQQFAEVLAKIPVETARQNELLAQISGRVSAAAESSAEMLEGLGRCNESLSQLDEKTVSQTECLREMTQTFTESDRGLKDLIRRQNKRFLWVFASAVGVCILSGAVLAVVLTSLIQS